MSMLVAIALGMSIIVGLPIHGWAETTKVLYSAPLGSGDTFALTSFSASVVNLDSTSVVATVFFCDLTGNCVTNPNSDCVEVTLAAQRGCTANFDQPHGGFRYAKIEIVSPGKKIIAIGQLIARIVVADSVTQATVPAR